MVEVTVRDKDRRIVGRAFQKGNERVFLDLCSEKYPLLSNIDSDSYDVFDQSDASNLILELKKVCAERTHENFRDHIDAVIKLLVILANTEGATVTFSPFAEEF